jgi:dipeptidyl aminopeptidase/acylaminoacyl peptidase
MRPILLAVILTLPLLAGLSTTRAGAKEDGPAPLIDRELFFGDPELSSAQLSPTGEFIAFIKPYRDVRNVWVKGIDEPFDAARPVTADERPVPGYFWSQDGKFILYVQDKGGNENFHVYAVRPDGGPVQDTGVPEARDLTPLENVRAAIYAVPEKRPGEMIVGLNDRDPAYHDVYRVDIATGERELLIKNTQEVGGYIFDLDGNVRLAMRQTDDGGTEILRVEGDDLIPIYSCTYEEECYPQRFHKNGRQVYLVSNKGDDVDLTRLMLMDPLTGQTELVESDPENEVDFGGAVFAEDTDELIATYYLGDRLRIYPHDDRIAQDLEWLRENLPEGQITPTSMTEDMNLWLVSVSSDVDPGSVYLYDRRAPRVELLYRSRPELPSDQLAHMKALRYKARDGREIPAYLTLPRGVKAKKLPTVIFPHGGPWARDMWGYDPYAQFLANRGYAVLQPNFRGSSGYGKDFLNAGNREWGIGAMQHDITDGVQYLIKEGIAAPERIGIFGGSYGGYATLAGVTYTPDLYAAAVPYVAPSNLITLIESFPAYWRPFLEGSWYKRVGDPEDPEDRQDLIARSPLFQVDKIKAPLLVVHGANDPRVKQRESDQIVVALRDKGQDVEYLVAPDEGHGFRSPENRLALAAAMEKFLAHHLDGRYQEDMTPEVAARLTEITVDPASVTLPDTSAAALAEKAKTAALPRADGNLIEPATLVYKQTMSLGGQDFTMEIHRSISPATLGDRQVWRIAEQTDMSMGSLADTFFVDRQTLAPVEREVGGMATARLTYSPEKITGELGVGGRTTPVDVALEAPVLGDGAALDLALAAMPISRGYETTYRVFDVNTQKVRPFRLEVTGKGSAEVPAGTFETYTVEIQPLDDDPGGRATLQVMREVPHHLVTGQMKMSAGMGGGEAETTLQEYTPEKEAM